MMLTPHFSLTEMTFTKVRLDNSCPVDLIGELAKTADMLERIRAYLSSLRGLKDTPIRVTSGYRCLAVNRAILSKDTSDHVKAMAADIKVPSFGTAYEVCLALQHELDSLGIGQLIHEFGSWVHVSTRPQEKKVNRILTIDSKGMRPGVHQF